MIYTTPYGDHRLRVHNLRVVISANHDLISRSHDAESFLLHTIHRFGPLTKQNTLQTCRRLVLYLNKLIIDTTKTCQDI